MEAYRIMKTIIFVYPKIDFEDNYPCSWIPYSIISLGSMISDSEYDVLIFDENKNSKGLFDEYLRKKNVLAVAFSIMTGGSQIENALELAERVKKYNAEIKTIFGGPHVNVLPIETLQHTLVDIVSVGPGQESIYELVLALDKKMDLSLVSGIYYKNSGMICAGLAQKSMKELSPYDFSLLDLNDYIQYDATIADRTINYIASQGCAYACTFCYECTYKQKYYKMPLKNVQKDLQFFVEKYHVNGIKFYDADLFIDIKNAIAISNMLKEYKLNWAASIHPSDILRAEKNGRNELLENIKNSNCRRLLMGIESGSNRILKDIIKKRVSKEEILFVAKRIAEQGILGSYTFMVGIPNETEEEQKETFELIQQLWNLSPRPETNVHIYLPYPGTPLYEEALHMGFVPPKFLEDWSSFSYYRAITPWTSIELEKTIKEFTSLIDKKVVM